MLTSHTNMDPLAIYNLLMDNKRKLCTVFFSNRINYDSRHFYLRWRTPGVTYEGGGGVLMIWPNFFLLIFWPNFIWAIRPKAQPVWEISAFFVVLSFFQTTTKKMTKGYFTRIVLMTFMGTNSTSSLCKWKRTIDACKKIWRIDPGSYFIH